MNIDEAMFSRSTKATYSWSLKGKESKLMNIWFSNSASLITAITSLGDVFAAEPADLFNKKLIIQVLEELERFMIENIGISIDKWLFIVDKASIYRCRQVKDYIARKSLKFEYIPPYSQRWLQLRYIFNYLKGMW